VQKSVANNITGLQYPWEAVESWLQIDRPRQGLCIFGALQELESGPASQRETAGHEQQLVLLL